MQIKLLRADAIIPTRSNPQDAGLDLHSPIDCYIKSGEEVLVPTGIAVNIPIGHVGLVFPRSGLATKYGIRLKNTVGVIDHSYVGELKLFMENSSYKGYTVWRNDRIAQLVIVPIVIEPIEIVEEFTNTGDRGGGFGHTGK